MKTKIFDAKGEKKGEISLPNCFDAPVREDLISKVVEAQKFKQPSAPYIWSGLQYSASGVIVHRRHVWKSGYGKGQSRVPRKIMSNKGAQFNLVGATSPNTRGGRRAHPPKVIAAQNHLKVNKKEMQIALMSALSATVNSEKIKGKYASLKNSKVEAPFIVEGSFVKQKTKEMIAAIEKILGKDAMAVAFRKKAQRAGVGKSRGRRYKVNAGALVVLGKDEVLKTGLMETKKAKELSVTDLASGGSGRITIYTENAINDLKERFK